VAVFAAKGIAATNGFAVGAERAVVDENAAVDLGDIDGAHGGGGEGASGVAPGVGEAEIAREVIERAEWQRTERNRAAGEKTGGGADGAVAAADQGWRRACDRWPGEARRRRWCRSLRRGRG